jgi:DNA-binding CsgD family transcriptional regulator
LVIVGSGATPVRVAVFDTSATSSTRRMSRSSSLMRAPWSAARTGREDNARAYLERLESAAVQTTSPYLCAQAAYARALLAPDEQAEELFHEALDRELASWPAFRARLQLWYGGWLRRRRVAESRALLRAARDAFDALGFADLAETARRELRAAGETSPGRRRGSGSRLTPQELQVAQMAAEGMSNREIGQQLYVSHRTVGYHLHHVFSKLGITSRGQLHAALPVPPTPE